MTRAGRLAVVLVGSLAVSVLPASGALGAAALPFPGADRVSFPTNLAFAPDGRLFFSEKETGRIRIVEDGRMLGEPFATLDVVPDVEMGLLGLALDPAFPREPWVYAYYTDAADGVNRLVRFEADGNRAGEPQPLLELLPTEGIHNGGDLVFGTDGKLYVTVGEVGDTTRAQDVNDLGGKVLRLNPDGSVPPDNPFGSGNPAFTTGLRNSFGICVDPRTGTIWETENGPERDDEVNRIEAGGNYGWPEQLGAGGPPAFTDPELVFEQVIVPTGCAVVGRFLYFGDFSGDLHRVSIDGAQLGEQRVIERFPSGITDVLLGPDGALYVATSGAILRTSIGDARPAETRSPLPAAAPSFSQLPPIPQPADEGGSTRIYWLLGGLAVAAVVAVLIALRLLSSRMREVRGPGEDGEDRSR
jgi:glucose/arabinose dehydrogenase